MPLKLNVGVSKKLGLPACAEFSLMAVLEY